MHRWKPLLVIATKMKNLGKVLFRALRLPWVAVTIFRTDPEKLDVGNLKVPLAVSVVSFLLSQNASNFRAFCSQKIISASDDVWAQDVKGISFRRHTFWRSVRAVPPVLLQKLCLKDTCVGQTFESHLQGVHFRHPPSVQGFRERSSQFCAFVEESSTVVFFKVRERFRFGPHQATPTHTRISFFTSLLKNNLSHFCELPPRISFFVSHWSKNFWQCETKN